MTQYVTQQGTLCYTDCQGVGHRVSGSGDSPVTRMRLRVTQRMEEDREGWRLAVGGRGGLVRMSTCACVHARHIDNADRVNQLKDLTRVSVR